MNYDGKGFGDNAKSIAEEIFRQGKPYDLIWLVKKDAFVPEGIKKVSMYDWEGVYALSTAKIIINNCKANMPFFFKKKKKQFYLQTWHGDFALKFIEKEVEDTLPIDYVAKSKADSAVTDAVISGSGSFSKILRESFWLPDHCAILEFGVPRNDLFFKGDEAKNQLKERYGFSSQDKILLYAPTFRDNGSVDCYDLDFKKLKAFLEKNTQEEWRVIIRLHPNISHKEDLFSYGDGIVNGTAYPDQQELCMISDWLITDYSSIMGDFLIMKKPVFLYVPDLDVYSSRTTGRGLRDLFYHLPLQLSRDQNALEEQITAFDQRTYEREVETFMQRYYRPFDDGHASERVVCHLSQVIQY